MDQDVLRGTSSSRLAQHRDDEKDMMDDLAYSYAYTCNIYKDRSRLRTRNNMSQNNPRHVSKPSILEVVSTRKRLTPKVLIGHSNPRSLLVLLYCILSLLKYTQAQLDTCVCSPAMIGLTLDFSLSCPPENVLTGNDQGIDDIFCQIMEEPRFQAESTEAELLPVEITAVNIFELGLDLRVIKQMFLPGVSFLDGETIFYESIIKDTPASTIADEDLPGGLQIVLKGVNSAGNPITNSFILTYSNLCDVVPFFEGNSIGWVVITSIVPPTGDFCPLFATPEPSWTAGAPSLTPSIIRSDLPSNDPSSVFMTGVPTIMLSDMPSETTSEMPSGAGMLSVAPSILLTNGPTKMPSRKPSRKPTISPTIQSRTDSPTNSPIRTGPDITIPMPTKAPSVNTGKSPSIDLPDSSDLLDTSSPTSSESESVDLPDTSETTQTSSSTSSESESESVDLPDTSSSTSSESESESVDLPDTSSSTSSESESVDLPDTSSSTSSESESKSVSKSRKPHAKSRKSSKKNKVPKSNSLSKSSRSNKGKI